MQPVVCLAPGLPQFLNQGAAITIDTAVSDDPDKKGVTWNLSPSLGSLNNQSANSVIYQAPDSVTSNSVVTISATSVLDPSQTAPLVVILLAQGQENVQPISVNGGPIPGQLYLNGPFTTVLICAPGTSNCQLIDGILVDTGSVGLRVFKSVIKIPLTPITQSGGTVNNCQSFVDQQYFWGEVAAADVYLAGERAAATSVQMVADPTEFTVPESCSNGGIDGDSQQVFPANGLLGVGPEPTDCTTSGANPCDPSSGASGYPLRYFDCFGSEGCAVTQVFKVQQVANPVALFSRDNNGDILEFPFVGTAMPTVDGTMTFGISTEPNNGVAAATVFAMDPQDNTTTLFGGQQLTQSFIDSGSNFLFFPNLTGLQVCSDASAYCPLSPPALLSAVNEGANKVGSGTVNFQVDNFDTDIQNNPNDLAFGYIAGPNGTPPCQNGKGACAFDWGLPFFYGRRVFTNANALILVTKELAYAILGA